eukprot:scaffold603_cov404-Prasinococcus_capsulatus_cf.AAC.39
MQPAYRHARCQSRNTSQDTKAQAQGDVRQTSIATSSETAALASHPFQRHAVRLCACSQVHSGGQSLN